MVTRRGRKALRRVLWWLGLSVLIILGRAVGASGDPIEFADTAQLADMCTRLASGIPLTMTTHDAPDEQTDGTDDQIASADTSWATPEVDYTTIMQHALSGLGASTHKPAREEAQAVEPAPAPEAQATPEPAVAAGESEEAEAPGASGSGEPGLKVARAEVMPTVWIAAFGAPGLVAIVVSIFGIMINRPERED